MEDHFGEFVGFCWCQNVRLDCRPLFYENCGAKMSKKWEFGVVRCGLYIVNNRSDCMLAVFGAEWCLEGLGEVPELHFGRVLVIFWRYSVVFSGLKNI